MRRFVEEADRGQWTLLPECLDDFIDESNPVRVIDVFVEALDLAEMSFEGVEPAATGRPSYHPSVLLKLLHLRLEAANPFPWVFVMRTTGADRDRAGVHVTIVDVPAFLRGIRIATAGKFGHVILKRAAWP